MSKHQEALRQLTQTALSCYSKDDIEYSLIQSHNATLQELIDKATPKKPLNRNLKSFRYEHRGTCPSCGRGVSRHYDIKGCSVCLQALEWEVVNLDWSEMEDDE